MKDSIVNCLSPGDKIIVVRDGKFSERFGEIAKAYGVEVIPIDRVGNCTEARGYKRDFEEKSRCESSLYHPL